MKSVLRMCVLFGGLLPGLAGAANAQAGGDPPMAMGSGRMVQGTVTAVAPDKLTIKTQAGEVFSVAVNPNTQVRKGRDLMKLADVHAGDGVGAMGEIDAPNKTVHALYLFVVDAETLKKARENLGKTYIAGKITAIDELKITVMRSDNVSQTIQVDEDTSFRRGGRGMAAMMGGMGGGGMGQGGGGMGQGGGAGANRPGAGPGGGESITLADIKVGDAIAGQGALKNGVFVPTRLMIEDPAATGGRHRGGPGGAGSSGPATPNGEPK